MADEAQTNNENDPVVDENAQAEPEQVTTSQQEQSATAHEHRNQWILFGILVGILIGVVLVIAIVRPLIFNRIVPAVMGDFNTPVPATVEETVPAESESASEDVTSVEENTEGEAAENDNNQVFIPAAASGDGTGDAVLPDEPVSETDASVDAGPPDEPAPEPTPEPVTHTVQVGDNLTKISQQYSVSVQEIMAANNLTNADYISVGQVLVIPTN